ncbi:MAG TPA: hypothetical protein VF679_08810 [Pedobacter sp.]|jgi:DNA mismatch repair ATPase MutS
MKFNIDQQSFKDLNIFSSSSNAEVIVNLFKHTKTIGGREMIYEMMRNPSSDLGFLANRTAAISWFLEHNIILDITSHQIDLIDHHLKHNKHHLKGNILDASVDFLRNKITAGADYYIVESGLTNFLKLAKFLEEYLKVIEETNAPEGLKAHAKRMTEILALPALKGMIGIKSRRLRFYHVSRLDGVFRKHYKKELNELLALVYELDVYETLAYITEHKGLSLPTYSESGNVSISIEALYHPGIIGAVTNNVQIDEHNNMTFLTGSNMAGKSSFLKATGLCVYLAHIGFPVFAKSMNTTIFSGIITTINLPDNLNDGLSHYYTEVKRVKETALQLRDVGKVFVIFDELFRGTNVKDAFDASLLVINELAQVKSSVFLISTHIVELAEELQTHKNVSFKYMDTFFANERPVFTYKLMDGISKERLGMYIVKNEGIVEIIQEAVKKH